MLTFHDHCRRFGRREFLRVGGLGGLGASALAASFARLCAAPQAASKEDYLRDKSVVFLFMHGGPSQTETFDPKMDAPSDVRSATGELGTKIPGVTFGGTFPKLANLANQFTVVRSFVTGDGNHDIKPVVGRDTHGANLGSLYSSVSGANDARTGMPTNVALFPRAVDESTQVENLNFGNFSATGTLGGGFSPFVPGAGGSFQEDLTIRLPMDRLEDRRTLLTKLDQLKRRAEWNNADDRIDQLRNQAFETLIGGVVEAFKLSSEDPRVVARYDTRPATSRGPITLAVAGTITTTTSTTARHLASCCSCLEGSARMVVVSLR